MSYAINHRKHVLEYFQTYKTGTAADIVHCMPERKRTEYSRTIISALLGKLVREGHVKQVAHGTYTAANTSLSMVDLVSQTDDTSRRILEVLKSGCGKPVHVKEVYTALARAGCVSLNTVRSRLRTLCRSAVIYRDGKMYCINPTALVAEELHQIEQPRRTRQRRLPARILGDTVRPQSIFD